MNTHVTRLVSWSFTKETYLGRNPRTSNGKKMR